ncbi:hypothetical protein C8F01DRAFT_1376177 [Mycena amicta]|nr:hypothetical protein C8F01DRAFT_1376177 [Mycena amicta]
MSSSSPICKMPPELLEKIVQHTNSRRSLFHLSLTNSIFREPSQRVLLCALTVAYADENHPKYRSVKQILAHLTSDDARLAPYITRLTLDIGNPKSMDVDDSAHETVQRILSILPSVRSVTIRGGRLELWNPESGNLARFSLVHDFLASRHDKLATLNIQYLEAAPMYVLGGFVSAAPNLKFKYSMAQMDWDVLEEATEDSDPDASVTVPAINSLDISNSQFVYHLMLTPAFAPYIRSLRELSYLSSANTDNTMCLRTANTLERLVFNLIGAGGLLSFEYTPIQLPKVAFPCLRQVKFQMRSDAADYIHFTDPRSTSLPTLFSPATCPRLETVVLHVRWVRNPVTREHIAELAAVARALDKRMKVHDRPPRCYWEFHLEVAESHAAACLEKIVQCVRKGMPWAVERGLFACREVFA